jgi:hypothetical protein
MRKALTFAVALWIVAGIAVYVVHTWMQPRGAPIIGLTKATLIEAPSKPSCWVVPAPIKQLLVVEPDRIICPVDRGRN